MKPHDRLMGLDLPHGGHLSHGYQLPNKKISYVSSYYETLPYRLDESTGRIDYDELEKNALLFRPKVIIAGASAYARNIDYERMKKVKIIKVINDIILKNKKMKDHLIYINDKYFFLLDF